MSELGSDPKTCFLKAISEAGMSCGNMFGTCRVPVDVVKDEVEVVMLLSEWSLNDIGELGLLSSTEKVIFQI